MVRDRSFLEPAGRHGDYGLPRAGMDKSSTRRLTSQLAEDLGWLEEHCRHQPGQAALAGQLRLAAAMVRNCIGPFLDEQPFTPLHVVVVGGAGAGKSTVVNLLSGAAVAEANPQAGFTRHPIAYTSTNGTLNWPAHLGFLGPLQRLPQDSPANLDEDVYQVRRIVPDPAGSSLLKDFLIWDCPDMTTWAATSYASRFLATLPPWPASAWCAAPPTSSSPLTSASWQQPGRTWRLWRAGARSSRPARSNSTTATAANTSAVKSSAASTRPWFACSNCWNYPVSAKLSAPRSGSCARPTGCSKAFWARRWPGRKHRFGRSCPSCRRLSAAGSTCCIS